MIQNAISKFSETKNLTKKRRPEVPKKIKNDNCGRQFVLCGLKLIKLTFMTNNAVILVISHFVNLFILVTSFWVLLSSL